jgi:carbamoyltransferase
MMNILGVSEGFHDAGICLLRDDKIYFASHSERHSQKKGDKWVHPDQLPKTQKYKPDVIAYYEKPFRKNLRRLYAGQKWQKPRRKYDVYFGHHESHAAAGYYTAPFDECNVLVIDAIGEWDTMSIWKGSVENGYMGQKTHTLKKLKSWKYPHSLGLLYSAITQRIGLNPNEDEYITMGMAAFGDPKYDLENQLWENNHRGVGNIYPEARPEDLAASIQDLYERELLKLVELCPHENLVIMGGCALNCVANSKIKGKNIWIMPSPGDAGSALGAAALVRKKKLKWNSPYLGTLIGQDIDSQEVVKELLKNKVCGVANGRAEFGPRALGNRSLLGDPRYDIKDTVNDIKKRQKFRPFAPAILEEYADEYFEGPMNEYMQFVATAKHDYSSVTHVDGTARVQVVKKDCRSSIRYILEEWYSETGCPMLLNTSLNIKGMPMVDTWEDAENFMRKYNVKVF